FGEIMSGVFMGMMIILISYYIQTGGLAWNVFLISLPITILVGGINLSNNIRDLVGDKENGRKTLPILAGRKNAVQILSWVFIVSYLLIGLYIVFGIISFWSCLVLLSLPKPIKAIKEFKVKEKPADLMVAMKSTAQTNTFFGLLLALALAIQYIF
ncbi:UbiA family prenyltransferase, partial [Bacillus swezeyi]|nr:UbiA family prenyltransferase [Bacillus swezeyi]